jgi:hypothetical protein
MGNFLFYPKITFQLNSFDFLLHPQKIETGSFHYSYTTMDVSAPYQIGGYPDLYFVDETNIEGHEGIATVMAAAVPPYIGLKIFLPFVGAVMRVGPLAFDISEANGNIGMESPLGGYLKNNYSGNVFSGVAAIDALSVFRAIRFLSLAPLPATYLHRILLGYRYSFVSLHPVINSGNAIPPMSYSPSGGSLYQPPGYSSSYTRNFYVGIEIGTLSLFWDFLPARYYPYASGTMMGLSWQFPIKRFGKKE